jgi:hypothetical protein
MTLLTSVFFVRTSVFLAFSPHGTMLAALIRMSVYGCSRMLDGFVSSHPNLGVVNMVPEAPDTY